MDRKQFLKEHIDALIVEGALRGDMDTLNLSFCENQWDLRLALEILAEHADFNVKMEDWINKVEFFAYKDVNYEPERTLVEKAPQAGFYYVPDEHAEEFKKEMEEAERKLVDMERAADVNYQKVHIFGVDIPLKEENFWFDGSTRDNLWCKRFWFENEEYFRTKYGQPAQV